MEEQPKQNLSELEKQARFNEEFVPHLDALYNFAFRLTYNEDDAKDLVQDAMIKAFRFINGYHEGTNAKAWLYRILKNSFINDYRKKSKQPSKVDIQEAETFLESQKKGVKNETELQVEVVNQMMGDEISKALNDLQEEFRTVIILCDLEDFTYEEMSKILDVPIGTVRSRLHRARKVLKEKLNVYASSMGFKER